MESNDVYFGPFSGRGSEWAQKVSHAIWHAEVAPPRVEQEYYQENPQSDFVNWFLGEPYYSKLKQH